jgi:multidrug efflux system membrane fusion protein
VNLIYCHIVSPIAGRVGLRQVDQGNLVQPTDASGIVYINEVHPINVAFSVPQDNLEDIIAQLHVKKSLRVEAYDRQQKTLLAKGTVSAVDNQIDPTTGTIKLKGIFKNERSNLFPNQFVNIRLFVKTLKHIIAIPTGAIQQGSAGPYVYVIDAKNIAHVKSVTVTASVGDETGITSGIAQGENVVVEGADTLVDGAQVILGDAKTPLRSSKSHRHARK